MRLYTTCTNPQCKGNPQGGWSWRYLDKGEPNCKYCNKRFDLSKFKVGSTKSNSNAPAKQSRQAPEEKHLSDEQITSILRQRLEGDESKLEQVSTLIPPKQKTEAELRKEAHETHEHAVGKHEHEARVLAEMQTKYAKMCGRLVGISTKDGGADAEN